MNSTTKYAPKFQMEWGKAPFGLRGEYAEHADDDFYRFNLEISMDEGSKEGNSMLQWLNDMDEYVLDYAVKNSQKWFKTELTKEQLRGRYRQTAKPDDTGVYPPLVRVKVQHGGPTKSQTRIWKHATNADGSSSVTRFKNATKQQYTLADLDTKFVPVRAIVRVSGVWFVGSQFGVALVATDVMFKETAYDKPGYSPFTERGGAAIRSVVEAEEAATGAPMFIDKEGGDDGVVEVPGAGAGWT